MVANDPHLSLQYPPLFHLSVDDLGQGDPSDNLDLAGGAFPGYARARWSAAAPTSAGA